MAKPSSSSFSLPTQGGGGGGRVQADQSNRSFSTTLHNRCLLRQLKTRRVQSQVELSHPESQRQGISKKKMVLFLALALLTDVVPDLLQLLANSEKQIISPETPKTNLGPSSQQQALGL